MEKYTWFIGNKGLPCTIWRMTSKVRVRLIAAFIAAIYAAALMKYWAGHINFVAPDGYPLGHDFYCFWVAGRLALHGQIATLIDPVAFQQALNTMLPGQTAVYPWNYPPTFLMVAAPLGLLPLPWAYGLFQALTFFGFAGVLYRIVPRDETVIIAAFSGLAGLNIIYGQNGFLTGSLFLIAVNALCRKDQRLAGIALGFLTIKPHLGVLVPLVLILTRQFKAIVWATVTAAALAAVSIALFGWAPWQGFFAAMQRMAGIVQAGGLPWNHMPSVFSTLQLLHVPRAPAMMAHCVVAAGAVLWLCRMALRSPQMAFLMLGPVTVLASPYIVTYDLFVLAPPVLWWGKAIHERGLTPYDRRWFGLAVIAPALFIPLQVVMSVPLGIISVMIMVGLTYGGLIQRDSATGQPAAF